MGHIEQGRKQPSLELLQKIAKKLEVKVNELIPF
jgi:DNA-binding XRE family transcriptional regulator